jgi:hypothetical protein
LLPAAIPEPSSRGGKAAAGVHGNLLFTRAFLRVDRFGADTSPLDCFTIRWRHPGPAKGGIRDLHELALVFFAIPDKR